MIIFYLVFPSHFPSIMDLYFVSRFLCIHFLLVFSNAGNHCTFNLKHFECPLVTSSMWHGSSLNKQLLASLVSYRSVVNMHQAIKSGVEEIDQQCSPLCAAGLHWIRHNIIIPILHTQNTEESPEDYSPGDLRLWVFSLWNWLMIFTFNERDLRILHSAVKK